MNKQFKTFILLICLFTVLPTVSAEASIFSKALDKARKAMQGAFQMSFLSSVPVVFYKDSFNRMFDYVNDTVDNMNVEYNGQTITAKEFQDDKQTHIKKSAELALHIKSLTGSKYLAYGLTLLVGLTKEAIDGSFLNPKGGRCKEDFYADIVGAKAVFGEEAVDKALNKYMGSFIKESALKKMTATQTANVTEDEVKTVVQAPVQTTETVIQEEVSYENVDTSAANVAELRQKLTQEYYKAAQSGDTEAMQNILQQINSLK